MFPFKISSLATAAVAIVLLAVGGLAAASPVDLSRISAALLDGAEARQARKGLLPETNCSPCRSGAVACGHCNKAPLVRSGHAQAPSLAPSKSGSGAAYDDKPRFTLSRFAIDGVVAHSNNPVTREHGW